MFSKVAKITLLAAVFCLEIFAAPRMPLEKCRNAADNGDAEAQWQMGQRYEKGDGVLTDMKRAVSQYKKAAEQKHKEACARLADMYGKGEFVAQDKVLAAKYRSMAEVNADNDSGGKTGGGKDAEEAVVEALAGFLDKDITEKSVQAIYSCRSAFSDADMVESIKKAAASGALFLNRIDVFTKIIKDMAGGGSSLSFADEMVRECGRCQGTGEFVGKECGNCGGFGKTDINKSAARSNYYRYLKATLTLSLDWQKLEIDSRSSDGTFLGEFEEGDLILFCYLDGEWTLSRDRRMLSPDVATREIKYRAVIQYADSATSQRCICTPLPPYTHDVSYVFEVRKRGRYYISIMDKSDERGDNRGSVRYAAAVVSSDRVLKNLTWLKSTFGFMKLSSEVLDGIETKRAVISARSGDGVPLPTLEKGDLVILQYQKGTWSCDPSGSRPWVSPDKIDDWFMYGWESDYSPHVVIGDASRDVVLEYVPCKTFSNPYVFVVRSHCAPVLKVHDHTCRDNAGEITYRYVIVRRSADSQSTVNREDSGKKLHIRAWIDGSDYLYVDGRNIWFEHEAWDLPGKNGNHDYPTYVNYEEWYPIWEKQNGKTVSEKYHISGLKSFGIGKISIKDKSPRGNVMICEEPGPENGYRLKLYLKDNGLGASWCEATLTW